MHCNCNNLPEQGNSFLKCLDNNDDGVIGNGVDFDNSEINVLLPFKSIYSYPVKFLLNYEYFQFLSFTIF